MTMAWHGNANLTKVAAVSGSQCGISCHNICGTLLVPHGQGNLTIVYKHAFVLTHYILMCACVCVCG